MGLQLIFCVEANSKSKSDYIYIREAVLHFYEVGQTNFKLSPVYMDGKGNYDLGKTKRQISNLEKQYQAGSKRNTSITIYCFDCDRYDSDQTDRLFLEKAKKYCKNKGFRFVWFAKNIECVFLGKEVADKDKRKAADSFIKKKMIQQIDPSWLRTEEYQDERSNLFKVLDDYLPRK